MTADIQLLMITAASIAFIHTLMGPDHYLPFVSMGLAKSWSRRKIFGVTAICGFGHIIGSIVLGFIGVYLQMQLPTLEFIESIRGDVAAWCLLSFGLAYLVWGLRNAYRNRPHTHQHNHGGLLHSHNHNHNHQNEHLHLHDDVAAKKTEKKKIFSGLGPWVIFIIFVLGPCEPLIPLLMYPAAKENNFGLLMVTMIFGIVTMLTMLFAVWLTLHSISSFRLPDMSRFGHAIAGATITGCGSSILFLGL